MTSALSVPAYAGIPVTHRDYCSSVHIITGHAKAGSQLKIDFDALRRTNGTLVFLMGVTALPMICKGLLDAGMSGEMPAAVVERGTLPRQRAIAQTSLDFFDGKITAVQRANARRAAERPLVEKPVQNKAFISRQLNKRK